MKEIVQMFDKASRQIAREAGLRSAVTMYLGFSILFTLADKL